MQATARYLDGARFEVEARGHRLICDQPRDNGGADSGMTPPEFLLASLASCAGYYAAQYLKARGLSAEVVSVSVTADKATQPARLGAFHIEVTAPAVGERHEAGLMRAVKACLVHNTLLGNPAIETTLRTVEPSSLQSGAETGLGQGFGNPAGAPPLEWRA